jgi:polar amino acid transport system substrate-binding protein
MPLPRKAGSVVATLITAVMFTGCASSTTSTGGGTSILTKVLQSKVLTVATDTANAPWETTGSNGQPQGFDIDIAKAIAQTLGATIKWDIVDSPGRITALQHGQAELVLGNFTRTATRALSVDFSDPYFLVNGVFLVKANSPLNTLSDLNNASAKVSSPRRQLRPTGPGCMP